MGNCLFTQPLNVYSSYWRIMKPEVIRKLQFFQKEAFTTETTQEIFPKFLEKLFFRTSTDDFFWYFFLKLR